jgi:hypothetical protein
VGGLMQTALANNRGELVIPVVITGTFDKPQVAPDMQKVAQMKLQNLLPTTGNPGSLSAGILGGLKGGNTGAAAGGLGGLVGTITGQQQQQPAQQQGQPVASPQNPPPQQQQQQPADAINQALQGLTGGKKNQEQNTQK